MRLAPLSRLRSYPTETSQQGMAQGPRPLLSLPGEPWGSRAQISWTSESLSCSATVCSTEFKRNKDRSLSLSVLHFSL